MTTVGTRPWANHRYDFNLNGSNRLGQIQASPIAARQALQNLQGHRFPEHHHQQQAQTPSCGCLPRPQVGMSGAPSGQGLSTATEDGWPEGTVTTAGGYKVVAEGNTNWSIYSPEQSYEDEPTTKVWGDPHVKEGDGTKWDFTESSDFVLPDGTRIAATTSSDTGKSVTTGLDITNGNDHVSVTNVNGNPTVSDVTRDGYQWRAEHISEDPGRDTFYLNENGEEDVSWIRQRDGELDGVVTGAHYDSTTQKYEQEVDEDSLDYLSAQMRPPLGSGSWQNLFGNSMQSQWGSVFGQNYGASDWSSASQQFGGWTGAFDSLSSPLSSLQSMIALLQSESDWQNQLQFGLGGNQIWGR